MEGDPLRGAGVNGAPVALGSAGGTEAVEADLVVVTLPGVQRFIAESRSTADLYAGSAIMSELASAMVRAVPADDVVLPSGAADTGIPNRVVALAPATRGRELAERMVEAVRQAWRAYDPAGDTVGFPAVQWVVISPMPGGYPAQWERAGLALAARKRIRDFVFAPVAQARVCSLTGRWPAVSYPTPDARRHDGVRRDEDVSAVGRAKRRFTRTAAGRFPSTWSIASAPYRAAVIARCGEDRQLRQAVDDLSEAFELLAEGLLPEDANSVRRGSGALPGLPGADDGALRWLRNGEGAWCAPETWDPAGLRRAYELSVLPDEDACAIGRAEAAGLLRRAGHVGAPPLTPYLAVLVQDADRMGERLSPPAHRIAQPLRQWHSSVSEALQAAAGAQRRVIENDHLGRVVYAGGDDLLALVPVSRALAAAGAANETFRTAVGQVLPNVTASSALLFFHASWPLQSAVTAAQQLLHEAKEQGRPGLAVAVLRRGGERTRAVLPWDDRTGGGRKPMIDNIGMLAAAFADPTSGALSGRLVAGLERDAVELASLGGDWFGLELARRAARHGAGAQAGLALQALCSLPGARWTVSTGAVSLARFIASQTAAGVST